MQTARIARLCVSLWIDTQRVSCTITLWGLYSRYSQLANEMSWPEVSSWALKTDFYIAVQAAKWTGMLCKRVPWCWVPFLTVAAPEASCQGLIYVQGSAAENSCRHLFCSAVYLGQNEVPHCGKNKQQANKTLHRAMVFPSRSSLILTEVTVSVMEEQSDLGTSDLCSSNHCKTF